MAYNLNAGLNRPVLARETSYGVASIDFTLSGSEGYPINQSYDTPILVTENYSKEKIKSTNGSHILYG